MMRYRVTGVKGAWEGVRLLMWEFIHGFLKEVTPEPRLERRVNPSSWGDVGRAFPDDAAQWSSSAPGYLQCLQALVCKHAVGAGWELTLLRSGEVESRDPVLQAKEQRLDVSISWSLIYQCPVTRK